MSTSTYPHYQVTADRNTGEWISDAVYVGEVYLAEWYAQQDTDAEHYDTYQVGSELRAVTVVWED